MTLGAENINKLQELARDLKDQTDTEAKMARLAAGRLLDQTDEDDPTSNSAEHLERQWGVEIAYTYDTAVTADSFQWTPGVIGRSRKGGGRHHLVHDGYGSIVSKNPNYSYDPSHRGFPTEPDFSLCLEANSDDQDSLTHKINLYDIIGYLPGTGRITEELRATIEVSAPPSLEVVGLHDGSEIINPYDLQAWFIKAGLMKEDGGILPVERLRLRQPYWKRSAADSSLLATERNDGLEAAVDSLFIEEPPLIMDERVLNKPDKGVVRSLVRSWDESEHGRIDDERLRNLVEIRDSWEGATIVETQSLVGDRVKYIALILPELASTADSNGAVMEWAIAENPQVGNALFIVNPYLLDEGVTWRDVLIETTKKTAVSDGAIRQIHTPGRWKSEVLDIITAPTSTES